jgi:hypothetical protein
MNILTAAQRIGSIQFTKIRCTQLRSDSQSDSPPARANDVAHSSSGQPEQNFHFAS